MGRVDPNFWGKAGDESGSEEAKSVHLDQKERSSPKQVDWCFCPVQTPAGTCK